MHVGYAAPGVGDWIGSLRPEGTQTSIPIAVGLIFAGAVTVLRAAHAGALGLATVVVVTGLLYFTKVGAYALMGSVALIYLGIHEAMPLMGG